MQPNNTQEKRVATQKGERARHANHGHRLGDWPGHRRGGYQRELLSLTSWPLDLALLVHIVRSIRVNLSQLARITL